MPFVGAVIENDRRPAAQRRRLLRRGLGGSPRVWVIAAIHPVYTNDLDSPGPAVLDLLAPYNVTHLHQVAPVPARLLVTLARGAPSMTVTEVAKDVSMTNQNASQALGHLMSAGWVTRSKPPLVPTGAAATTRSPNRAT
jgi:hypothetical protein